MKKYYLNKPRRKSSYLKKVIICLVAVVILVGILGVLDLVGLINLPFMSSANKESGKPTSGEAINYNPPTEEEKKETEVFKDNLLRNNDKNEDNNQGSQKKTVTPIISSWGQNQSTKAVEVAGLIAGIFEKGGTCTLYLEKNEVTVTGISQATANAQSVSCGYISIPRDKLSPGSWKVKITYSSNSSEGTSQQDVNIDVQ